MRSHPRVPSHLSLQLISHRVSGQISQEGRVSTSVSQQPDRLTPPEDPSTGQPFLSLQGHILANPGSCLQAPLLARGSSIPADLPGPARPLPCRLPGVFPARCVQQDRFHSLQATFLHKLFQASKSPYVQGRGEAEAAAWEIVDGWRESGLSRREWRKEEDCSEGASKADSHCRIYLERSWAQL